MESSASELEAGPVLELRWRERHSKKWKESSSPVQEPIQELIRELLGQKAIHCRLSRQLQALHKLLSTESAPPSQCNQVSSYWNSLARYLWTAREPARSLLNLVH